MVETNRIWALLYLAKYRSYDAVIRTTSVIHPVSGDAHIFKERNCRLKLASGQLFECNESI